MGYSCNDQLGEPSTIEEALSGPEASRWKEAMKNEVDSIENRDVWTCVKPPNDKKPIK